jgi:uncharacterized repeat protein (TIGR01451 family)
MRNNAPARRLTSLLLSTFIILSNLLAPSAGMLTHAATLQQTQITLDGFVKNQFGDPVAGALNTLSGDAPPTPTNGLIAFSRVDSDYTVNGLYLINPDGSGETRIPGTQFDSTPVWSPDGTRIAVSHGATQHSGSVSGWGVDIINSDGTARVHLNDSMEPQERVAWSPNGQKIAYTSWGQLGANADIIVMGADGSNPVNLTNNPAYDYLPTWSPDGSKIAFTSDRSGNLDIFVMNTDGTNVVNLTNFYANDYYPSWSPDGTRIAFISSNRGGTFDHTEVCVMNADGSNVVNLTVNQVNEIMPAWSPDGTRIVFNSDRNGNRDLYSINADGSGEVRITSSTSEDSRASWQPLGVPPLVIPTPTPTPASTPTPQPTPAPTPAPTPISSVNGRIAYSSVMGGNQDIYLMDADGTNQTRLTTDPSSDIQPAWSPDGTKIAFVSGRFGDNQIYVMNADGSNQTRLTGSIRYSGAPKWSPDGTKIVFASGRDENSEIYVMNADGSGQVNLTNNPADDSWPDWSPDGTRIAFMSIRPGDNTYEIYVMNADGSGVHNITNNLTVDEYPAWSPDGTKIVFGSFRNEGMGLYLMNADGSNQTQIPGTDNYDFYWPTWSPDGTKVLVSNNYPPSWDIYAVNVDGSGKVKLTTNPSEDYQASWQRTPSAATPTPTPTPVPTPKPSPAPLRMNGRIAFTGGVGTGSEDILTVNPDGTGLAPFINTYSHEEDPAWSPDGTHLAYSAVYRGRFEIYRVNADGTNSVRLSDGYDASLSSDDYPSWSPDGSKLVFVRSRQLWTVGSDGGQGVKLSSGNDQDEEPAWSPDGTKIAFVRNWSSAQAEIFVMNADGTGQVNISNYDGPDRAPAWSPDGSKLVFQRWSELWTMNPDGSNQTQLTFLNNPYYSNDHPVWSPDGTQIAFESFQNNTGGIYVMNADGSNQTLVAPNGSHPTWRTVLPLALTNTATPNPALAGEDLTYTLAVTNNYSSLASGVNINDPLPTGTTFVSASTSQGTCTTPNAGESGTVTCSLGDIANGAQATVTLVVHVTAASGATLRNTATASGTLGAAGAQSYSATTDTVVFEPQVDMLIYKYAPPTFEVSATNNQMIYYLYVANYGPQRAHDIVITDALPDGVTFNSINTTKGTCQTPPAGSGGTITCSMGDMDFQYSYEFIYITVNVTAPGGTTLQNNASVASTSADRDSRNNSATATTELLNPPVPTPTPTPLPASAGQLVFVSQRDGNSEIYTANADGSGLLNLSNDPAYDYEPAWSPDGSKIAFSSDSGGQLEVWLMNADGSNRHPLTTNNSDGSNFQWSPDGSKLAWVNYDSNTGTPVIRIINADGTGLTNLTTGLGNPYQPVWSPDGTKLAFEDRDGTTNWQADIFVINADGTGLVNITNRPDTSDIGPQWSPDGTKLAFITLGIFEEGIYVMNSDGTNQTHILSDSPNVGRVSWSPDGSRLAFERENGPGYDLFTINPDGSNLTQLTTGLLLQGPNPPRWSPDGGAIAFTNYDSRAGNYEVFAFKSDGTLGSNVSQHPAYDSDAKWRPAQAAPTPTPTPLSGPPNNFFQNAQAVAGASGSVTGTNVDADVEPGEQGMGGGEPFTSVWYSWTATGNGQATFTTAGSDFDTQLIAFTGTSLADLQNIAENDDADDLTSSVSFPTTAGTTYYLSVNGYGGSTGNIVFNWSSISGSAPPNDNFAAAAPLSGIPSTTTGNNTFATVEPGEPDHVEASSEGTIWYAWTPQTSGRVIFDTAGSTFDTVMAVYTGASLGSLNEVVSNDDDPFVDPPTSRVAFDAVAGTTYFIVVGGYSAERGDVTLNWRVSPPLPAATRVPGTGQIAFVSNRADDGNRNIFLMNADGGSQGYLTNNPAHETNPVWSRDTTRMLFIRRVAGKSHIFVMNSNGTGQTDLTPGPDADNDQPVWSPDGTRIAFHALGAFGTSSHQVFVMNADGTNPVNVSNYSGPGAFNSEPAWSPDGTRIAFRNDRYGSGDIFSVKPDGTNLVRLTSTFANDDRPVWSPDGQKILFLSDSGGPDLNVMNADGTGLVRLTTDAASESNYTWSPDGSKVVFEARVNGNSDIFVVNSNGSGARANLSNNSDGDDGSPVWSPDGTHIAFTSDRDGNREVYVMAADGSAQTNLTNSPTMEDSPAWEPPLNTPSGANVTLAKNGVTLNFSNVSVAGETTVTQIDPNSLQGIPGEYVINANSLAFEIHTTAQYTGPITIGFPVPGVNNPITFSALRVLHGEPPPVPNFVDRTVLAPDTPAPNFPTRTISARVSSLSPFVVVEHKETIPPVTTATLSAQPNAAGWHKANVNVTLTSVDNEGGSGVASLTYSATGAQVIPQTTVSASTATIPVTTGGTTTITYRARDVNGNVEAAKTITVKLDKTAPAASTSTVNSTPNSSGYYNGLTGAPAVTLSANDLPAGNASGIAGFIVSATGAQTIPANTFVPASNPVVQITSDGTTTLNYRAVDNAGNEGATASRTLKVDATAPTTSYSVSSAGTNVTLTVNFHDNLSGYAAVNFSVNDGQWQTYTGPFPSNGTFSYTFNGPYHESGSYTLKYYGTDVAGNKETTKTVTFTIPPQAITPTLASVKKNSNGTYTATFGYRNDNPVTFNIAVGTSNNFSPGNQNRGQTTAFQTGTVANAFTVTWDGSSLTWSVKGPDGQTRRVIARKP